MSDKIPNILEDLARLLEGPPDTWAATLRALAAAYVRDPPETAYQIRRMFAGMGSLNDIVVSDANGNIDQTKQLAFDSLRDELYELVQQIRD